MCQNCEEALKIQKDFVKALYRRAVGTCRVLVEKDPIEI
jgi:hypothetical protein